MFDTFFYEPIYNLMVFLSNYLVDFGTVIIVTTIIVKIILYPLYTSQIKNTIATKKAQPELKEIQKKLKDKSLDQFKKQELMLKMMKVNKKHGVKILMPILSMIFQITITIALYWIIYYGGFPKIDTSILYSGIESTKDISMWFLNFFDLTKTSWILAVLAGVTQYIHMSISMPDVSWKDLKSQGKDMKEDMMASFQAYMKYGLPVMVFVLLLTTFNAGLGLYWVTTNLFMIFQEKAVRADKNILKEMNDKEKEEKEKKEKKDKKKNKK